MCWCAVKKLLTHSLTSNISSTSHMTYLMPVLELCYFHICPFVCFFLNYLSKMNDVMNEVKMNEVIEFWNVFCFMQYFYNVSIPKTTIVIALQRRPGFFGTLCTWCLLKQQISRLANSLQWLLSSQHLIPYHRIRVYLFVQHGWQ